MLFKKWSSIKMLQNRELEIGILPVFQHYQKVPLHCIQNSLDYDSDLIPTENCTPFY